MTNTNADSQYDVAPTNAVASQGSRDVQIFTSTRALYSRRINGGRSSASSDSDMGSLRAVTTTSRLDQPPTLSGDNLQSRIEPPASNITEPVSHEAASTFASLLSPDLISAFRRQASNDSPPSAPVGSPEHLQSRWDVAQHPSARYEFLDRYMLSINYQRYMNARESNLQASREVLRRAMQLPPELSAIMLEHAMQQSYSGSALAVRNASELRSYAEGLLQVPNPMLHEGLQRSHTEFPQHIPTARSAVLRGATIQHQVSHDALTGIASVRPGLSDQELGSIRHLHLVFFAQDDQDNSLQTRISALIAALANLNTAHPNLQSLRLTIRFPSQAEYSSRTSAVARILPVVRALNVMQTLVRMGPWRDDGGELDVEEHILPADPGTYFADDETVFEDGSQDDDEESEQEEEDEEGTHLTESEEGMAYWGARGRVNWPGNGSDEGDAEAQRAVAEERAGGGQGSNELFDGGNDQNETVEHAEGHDYEDEEVVVAIAKQIVDNAGCFVVIE